MKGKRFFLFVIVILFSGCAAQNKIPKGSLDPHTPLSQGRLYLVEGAVKKAETSLNKIINEKPNSEEVAEAYYLLGEVYRKDKQNKKAAEMFKKVYLKYKNNPYSALAMRKESLILRDSKHFKDAVELLKKAIEAYPVQFNFESCTYAIGHIYLNSLNDKENATVYFKKLLEKNPKNIHYEVKAIHYLASIFYEKKDYKNALFYYQDLVDRFGWSKEAQEAVDKLDELEAML